MYIIFAVIGLWICAVVVACLFMSGCSKSETITHDEFVKRVNEGYYIK